jgi:hypothetical protein
LIQIIKRISFVCALIYLTGCGAPQTPPEAQMAEKQELSLWRSGAQEYLPVQYDQYRTNFLKARTGLFRENSRFVWFRNYKTVQSEFRNVLQEGNRLSGQLEQKKQDLFNSIGDEIVFLQNRIDKLKELTGKINEGRLARRDLVKAEVLLLETQKYYGENDFQKAEERINMILEHLYAAESILFPIFNRYTDKNQIMKWKQWVEDTVNESKAHNSISLVINKSERLLTVYKKGILFKTYPVGLGQSGSQDKLHAGDRATPEGRYRVTKKLPKSRYRKALLINYPNEDDRRQFQIAKEKGLVPRQTGIGGLIEIHGGGKDIMTYGCIAMNNKDIDELFKMVKIGTPVTIVGAVSSQNSLSSHLEGL